MSDRNTRYQKTYDLNKTIVSVLILISFAILFIYLIITSDEMLGTIIYMIFLVSIVVILISSLLGIIKGKRQLLNEDRLIKNTNPYIYFRELPNNFGIGITSLLIDSTIENYKDIIAVILDLCARGYLNLIKNGDKYILKVLKDSDDKLLNNEKYILYLLKTGDIKNINYQEWYNYCMQDGIDLGLYYHKDRKNIDVSSQVKDKIYKRRRIHLFLSIVLAVLVFNIFFIPNGNITESLGYGLFFFVISYAVLYIPFYIINLFTLIKYSGKKTKDESYNTIMNNVLTKTDKGIEEVQKLYSFKAFIKDFGSFASKKADEVVLWDRYLSYAQVFGLTKEIMKSGYKELVQNSSFSIDDIDNINFDNIDVNNN